ncbi:MULTISPECIES: FtsX-like permease family protein [unclassified Sulfurospirillum]|uniref:ABC transporter permease n=1 Tax=unclassified Sulfurospirillum TaxID=2618290 RepID=UPI0005085DB7|nr:MULTISPECIES: FtsX-like permease family protein [unclassified Sulfurospirillum]KFL33064.1 ABC transporter permease [Sulfurospirillum sp. SCADC]
MIFNMNFLLLDYAIRSLMRRFSKNFFIFLILSLLIFLLASVLMIADAIKLELNSTLKTLPQITLQRFIAGKQSDVPIARAEALLDIEGINAVTPRVWGYYYFKPAGVNFSVVGIDAYEEQYSPTLTLLTQHFDMKLLANKESMIVGEGVKKILAENYYSDFFNFITPKGEWKRVPIAGVFHSDLALESNDLIILPKKLAYAIFGMEESKATDIVVKVANVKEIATIVQKITARYPDMRAITQDDIRVSYQNIFDYKSGFFLSLFSVCAFAFFIIIYDKTSGLSSEEKREIGILKAIGWSSDDIVKEKFYESFILSLGAFLVGISSALFYVYALQAPLLRNLFMGYSELKPTFLLPFSFNLSMVILLFLLSVPIYIAATLIPSWRASSLDADEVMR